MIYQFETPPARESIIQEFGINPESLLLIENFIHNIATSEDDFGWWKDKYSMAEAAYILKRYNLVESFAMLHAIPGRPSSDFFVFAEPRWGVLSINACFDKFGKVLRWRDSELFDSFRLEISSSEMVRRSPNDFIEDDEWMAVHSERAWRCAMATDLLKDTTGVMAVSCFTLSATQWRRKYVAERWFHPHLKPSDRLLDPHDLVEWDAQIKRMDGGPGYLDRFIEWARGRESWPELNPDHKDGGFLYIPDNL